ncbi:hypothetical protein ATANTOWER_029818 [Ataeniobius toweri]|uniref:Uncharacterized protein n=1 Tax=Ataeniobius toweri TaxID=208326 RepID=A0ABU7ARJ3_9TELE|nr:hypothetical protein [Ataeniobius toweri]
MVYIQWFDVQSGEMYIRGDTESGQLCAHYNPFVPEPSKAYTPQVGGPACYEPFSDRIQRDADAPTQHSPPRVYPPPTGVRQTLLGNFKEKLSVLKVSGEDGACGSNSQSRQKTRPKASSSEPDGFRSGDRQTVGTPGKVEISLKGNWMPQPELKEDEESV